MGEDKNKVKPCNTLQKIVNSSGFPLQIAIQNEVDSLPNWRVVSPEHPWKNAETGNSGFIDLVIEKGRRAAHPIERISGHKAQKLVIECKRVPNAEDTAWVFLCSQSANLDRTHIRAWVSHARKKKLENFGWEDIQLGPRSPESAFCAICGQDNKRQLLERLASELIEATEALAREEYPLKSQMTEGIDAPPPVEISSLYYFPVIVTTANLYICKFNATDISLHNGQITTSNFEPVPMVRFRKSLATQDLSSSWASFKNISEIARAKERTVLVINAEKLSEILREWEMDED